MSARFNTSSAARNLAHPRNPRAALNSVVSAMSSGLSPVAFVVVLALIFMPTGHFLFVSFLFLPGVLVHLRGS